MVKIFIQFVCWALKSVHNISCDISNVLWLSSSSNEKFSAHLIFQLNEFAYENNVQLGYFVNYICNELENPTQPNEIEMVKKPSKEELNMLFVKNEKENITLFCDKAVYYRNKNFRLFLSTKFGDERPFLLSKENKYCLLNKMEVDIFLDSLITYFENTNIQLLKFNKESEHVRTKKKSITNFIGYKGPVCHYQHSNYPQIDQFIKDLIFNNGKGYIYKIDFYQNSILEYSTCNYRYCKNIGREHKSNNVIIVVSLKKRVYFQKCYDPECRQSNYKSEELPLPSYLFDDDYHYQRILDESLSTDEEEMLLEELLRIEEKLQILEI
ncbi:DNA-directed primase/polymerase protein-like [Centruroides vittatus]|uniref:DNA-directed primase/polymerase protein-like n=1 Tax=Centruroides vittatus TaxID=120091 RepID=UPI0035106B42